MKVTEKFNILTIPIHKVVFTLTSDIDYSMERLIFVGDYPDDGQYLMVEGSHCSCYGFDDTEWTATYLEEEELKKLLLAWLKQSSGLEPKMAALVINYLGK